MAVDRTSAFRPHALAYDNLTTAQPRASALRGVAVRDQDILANPVIPDADDHHHEVLPVGEDDGNGGAQAQTPVETYLAWLNRLAQLARGGNPDMKAMLQVADDFAIPRQTALQDMFDALGISQAAAEDPQLQDWMSMLLRNGGDLDLDVLSNILDMMRTIADPEHKRKVTGQKAQDRVLAEVHALKDQLTNALGKLDSMQNRADDAFNAQQAQIDALSQQLVAWQHYDTDLQGLSQRVTAAVASNGLDSHEIWQIAVDMHNLQAPGEAKDYVSVAEWRAAVAGVYDAHGTAAEETIAIGQIAEQLLDRETAGIMKIDAAVRDEIVQAKEDGQAAQTAAADTRSTVPETPTPAASV